MGESSENKKTSLSHLDFILFARMDKANCLKFPEGFEEKVPFLPFSRHIQNIGYKNQHIQEMLDCAFKKNNSLQYKLYALNVLCTQDFLILDFSFEYKTALELTKLAKITPTFIRVAQNNQKLHLRGAAADLFNELSLLNAGKIPTGIVFQDKDGLCKRDYCQGKLIDEKATTMNGTTWLDNSPFFIFADLNHKGNEEDNLSSIDIDIEKNLLRIAGGRSGNADNNIPDDDVNGSILRNSYIGAFQYSSGVSTVFSFNRYESFLREYERALLDKVRAFQYIYDIEKLLNGADFVIGENNRENACSILSAARNFVFLIQHRISNFKKSKNISHDLYSSFMEASGACDELENLSTICQSLRETIKEYDKKQSLKLEHRTSMLLNLIAILTVVSAIKDGADLIKSIFDENGYHMIYIVAGVLFLVVLIGLLFAMFQTRNNNKNHKL